MNRYRIMHHSEEFQCPECGDPRDVGDTAVEAYGDTFCSRKCAEENRARRVRIIGANVRRNLEEWTARCSAEVSDAA